MKHIQKLILLLIISLFMSGCFYDLPADLVVKHVTFIETNYYQTLDMFSTTYFMPDNPNFDISDPATWTGNMAQYVNHSYVYQVSYTIDNAGGMALDVEVDIEYVFDYGDSKFETVYIGDINPGESIDKSVSVASSNRELVEVVCEVFWYDLYEE